MQVIVFANETGGVGIIFPAAEFTDQIDAVAVKDSPKGAPFVIVALADLPDRATRDAWLWSDFAQAE